MWPEPVADQRKAALHEEDPDRGRSEPDEQRCHQRAAHEVEFEHAHFGDHSNKPIPRFSSPPPCGS